MSDPVDRQSFWTTMPGILTGTAALITALVGAFAVLASGAEDPTPGPSAQSGTSMPTASEAADGPVVASSPQPPDSPSPANSGVVDPAGPTIAAGPGDGYLLREDGRIDVDSGQFGSGVEDAEVDWSGIYVRVYGERRVQVDEMMDGAGCAGALERGVDDEQYEPPEEEGGLIICVRSDEGRLAILSIGPETDEDRLPVAVTALDS